MQNNKVAKAVWALLTWAIIVTLVLSGCGAQKPKVYHVGLMSYGKAFTAVGDGIKEKMTELGYIEGQNVVYETRIADEAADDAEELRLAKELVDAKVDVLVAFPSPSVVAAIKAAQGTDIPVIFVYYPIEGNALIKSVREPGGNITGVRYPGPELMTRRMQLLHAIAPQVKRVWIGYNATGPNTAVALDALRPAAAEAGITLVEVPVAKIEELAADLAARDALDDPGMDAILLMPDSFNTSTDGFAMLSKFATEHNLPLVGSLVNMVDSALFVNTIDNKAMGKLAAPTIDKVLHGAQAGTLPVITPDQTLIVNNKVAQQLGLTVPEGVLEQANKIIK